MTVTHHWTSDAPIGELIIGETPSWEVGVCTIQALPLGADLYDQPRELEVRGEYDQRLLLVSTELNADSIDEMITHAVDSEMKEL